QVDVDSMDDVGRMAAALNHAISAMRENLNAVARTAAVVENTTANIIYADTDLKIRYLNPAMMKTFRTLEKYLPVKVDQMIGQSIDIFHKNPAHQRNFLPDPSRLPYKGQIQLGNEILDLVVAGMYGPKREYFGPMVTWELATERIANERKTKELAEQQKKLADELRQQVDSIL